MLLLSDTDFNDSILEIIPTSEENDCSYGNLSEFHSNYGYYW